MNKEIDINKFNKSITFQNRGIGFTQIGIAGEILDLIDDLQQENKHLDEVNCKLRRKIGQLKDNWNTLREYVGLEWYSYDNESVEFEVAKDILNKMQELEG